MNKVWKAVDGNKTYIGYILMGLVGMLWHQGLIGNETASLLEIGIGVLTGVSARMGTKKAEEAARAAVPPDQAIVLMKKAFVAGLQEASREAEQPRVQT